jgi:type II secretory pathway component PulC
MPQFDTRTLNRLLRKGSVEYGVYYIRIILSTLSVVLLCWFGYLAWQSMTSTSALLADQDSVLENAGGPSRAGTSAQPKSRDYAQITKRAIFGPIGVKAPAAATVAPKVASSVALALIGTFLSGTDDAYAIIEDKKKNVQDVFNLNESVFGDAKLVSVQPDRVELLRNGQREILKLDDSPDSSSNAPAPGGVTLTGTDEYVVDETELNQALENLPLLLTQARAVPYFRTERPSACECSL